MDVATQPVSPPAGADADYAIFPKSERAEADDGTSLAWTRLPAVSGLPARRPVVTISGWSCSDAYWAHIAPRLTARGHDVVIVDTRGHGASGLPRHPGRNGTALRAEDISMTRLAADVTAVMDAAAIDDAVLMGHSMGVQIALEVHRQHAARVAGLALVAGSFENPLRTLFGVPVADALFPFAQLAITATPAPITRLAMQPARISGFGAFAARMARATGPGARPDDLAPYLRHIAASDMAVLMRLIGSMRSHSAADHLRSIDVPTLILAGGRDTFTPPRCSTHMFERIPTAEIQWFPEAGHTLPIEEPEAIVDQLDEWYRRRLAPSAPAAPSSARSPRRTRRRG